jgi:hypothetical protein
MIEKILEMARSKALEYIHKSNVEASENGNTLDFERFCGKKEAYEDMLVFVQEVAKEYGNGWISCSERLPSKEECGNFERAWFQVTIPQSDGDKTTVMQYEYTTIRGKETARWLWYGRIASVEPIAWKFLDAPYQKGE